MKLKSSFIVLLFSFVLGCSSEVEEGEHVWKEQTDTIEKAEQVEKMVDESLKDKMNQIGQ